jgi:2-keto-4-pentenoate hydratase/2-oxohepta-3-ene-1,7-dioic acid hydratase in catechol pathway
VRFARLRGPDGATTFARLERGMAFRLEVAPWMLPGAPAGGLGDSGASGSFSTSPATAHPYRESDFACPVRPSKIVCIGRNYVAHAKELGHDVPVEPLLFLKPPSSLIGPSESIVLPLASARVEHEAELGVVIGRRARNVSREDALSHVFGYTCVCDVTARDLQKKDGQWTRAKGMDTFCPVGPFIETDFDLRSASIRCRVNGEVRQDGSTANMIFDVPMLIAYVSGVMTLEPGDLLLTGTPEGVGPLLPGDKLEIEIVSAQGESLGILRERVVATTG